MRVSIKRDRGMLKVDIDGRLYPPLSFKSFRPNPANISEFYRAGVRLFSVLSSGIICALGVPYSRFGESRIGEGRYDFSAIDRQMDMFMENAPRWRGVRSRASRWAVYRSDHGRALRSKGRCDPPSSARAVRLSADERRMIAVKTAARSEPHSKERIYETLYSRHRLVDRL